MARPLFLVATLGAAALGHGTAAMAADAPAEGFSYSTSSDVASPITDRFYLNAIFAYARANTTLRLDPTGVPYGGTTLSGERDLGWARDNPDGRIELMFRLRERSRVRVDYLQLNRSGDVTLDHTIIFGNEVFNAGHEIQSSLNLRLMSFTYTYAFLQSERFELGGGLGVHPLWLDVIGQVPSGLQRHESSVGIAIPSLALDGIWRISRRFAFTMRAEYLGGTVSGYSGSYADYHGDFQYRWRKNFALGLGYSYLRASYESLTHTPFGRITFALQGPEAFVRVAF